MPKSLLHLFRKCSTCVIVGLGMFFYLSTAIGMEPDFERLKHSGEMRFGLKGFEAISAWEHFLAESLPLGTEEKIQRVNSFFNLRIAYVEDTFNWGKTDYWATPVETLGLGSGDCEDYALAKYVSLRLLGVPARQLRLTYVRAKMIDLPNAKSTPHMVLSYYPSPQEEPLILDSLRGEVLPASRRRDLFPIYSFNTEELWVTGRADPVAKASAKLSNWRDVLLRMREEGLN